MKRQISAISTLMLMACCFASGQNEPFNGSAPPAPTTTTTEVPAKYLPSPQMRGRIAAVKEYMRYPSPLSPIGDLTLSMMGDEAAFIVSYLMTTMPPLTPAQKLTVLDIIHNSFKMPAAIRDGASYNPKNSLALLKMLQATAVDQAVKERIATEVAFLTTLPKTITRPPWVNLPSKPASKPGVLPMAEDFQEGKTQ
jgi:hypothetical protein